ncbi:response regulator transcription factor [Bifidobacterium aesculapii]|uniref:response regulator transcription factor n=1 Tax=Bifidobacterium aesculapii TaxID=1329411 RepID=UPI0006E16376|nr:response regulator transcription factor [Bifidobacterium aesculapii]
MSFNTATSIAIVDNDTRSLDSLYRLLTERLPTARVIWMVQSAKEAMPLTKSHAPSLLLLDMSLEGVQGPSACRFIRKQSPDFPILAMTSFSLNLYEAKAKAAGAQGLASKNTEDGIITAIDSVIRNGSMAGFESRQLAHIRLMNETVHNQRLTLREEEIIDLCADEGLLDTEIAGKLGISEATVRKHMQHIMQKLGARTARQAVAIWLSPRG